MLDASKHSCCVSTLELRKNRQALSSKLVSVANCHHYIYKKGETKPKRNDFFNSGIMNRWNIIMFEVNFLLIKALIELLQRKISLNTIIPLGSLMLVRHSDIFLSSRYPRQRN